jgi:hypothetical protein
MKTMADKTKDTINKWIPGIVDTISGIADSAMKVLKSIADKIGGWISNLFTSDDEKKIQEAQKVSKNSMTSKPDDKYSEILVRGSTSQLNGLNLLYKSSIEPSMTNCLKASLLIKWYFSFSIIF